jgi:hypothetical protein
VKRMRDKFQIGNILYHVPTKSRWLIVERHKRDIREQTSFWRLRVKAYCLYMPNQKDKLWKANRNTNFILQDKDLCPKDKIWKVLHEKD